MKKVIFLLLFFVILPVAFSDSISDVNVPSQVRLGEKATIEGTYDDGNAFILCKFQIQDVNSGDFIERWSDEYTFYDGTFYAEKTIQEPPYYRGDDFNIIVTCGTATGSGVFEVVQPVSLAHPVQKWWEYGLAENNTDAVAFFLSFVIVAGAIVFIVIFAYKKMKGG